MTRFIAKERRSQYLEGQVATTRGKPEYYLKGDVGTFSNHKVPSSEHRRIKRDDTLDTHCQEAGKKKDNGHLFLEEKNGK